jgi:site-specific recombinase XerD
VRDRVGLSGWSVYALRHYAITSWLRKGIPIHVVQKMAGHRNMSTTQHYVHFLKEDLEDARRLDGDQGNQGVTTIASDGGDSNRAA